MALRGIAFLDTRIGDVFIPGITPPVLGGPNASPGSIDGMPINQTTQAAVGASALKVGVGTKTATAAAGAATLNQPSGVVTSEALTTAAGATYTLTLTDSQIAAGDLVFASVNLGAGTGGTPTVASATSAAGSAVVVIQNIHATAAFNAAIQIPFLIVKA